MAAEVKKEIQLEIGHVLFIDIVGYTKLLIHEQTEHLRKLREIVRGTEQFRVAEAERQIAALTDRRRRRARFSRKPGSTGRLRA